MTNPPTLRLDLTVNQIVGIADVLKDVRSGTDYQVTKKGDEWNDYQKETISRWTVTNAEEALVKRARLAELITLLTGETFDDSANVANVAEGRRLYDAQEARLAELAEDIDALHAAE